MTDCGRVLTPPATGTCTVVAGTANLLIEGTVLTETESLRGGQVVVDATGHVTCAACNCESDAAAAGATRITCANGVISPGLINSHDHVTFDQLAPYAAADVNERYEHRHDWRKGARGHTRIPSPSGGNAATTIGELRQMLGGATAINGSGGVQGLLRNLDKATLLEGLTGPAVAYQTFPLGDSAGTLVASGCGYPGIDLPTVADGASAYTPHISEGINVEARNEFLCASSSANGGQDLAMAKSAFIHGIGLLPEDMAIMAADSTGLIWSPRSNISLYGHTAQVTMADALGIDIALGTDWTPSGSINLLRELACARSLNEQHYGGYFSDKALWEMVTLRAARVMGMDTQIGKLAAGMVADIAIFAGDSPATGPRRDWRAVITADLPEVVLVLRGGKVMNGDAAVVAALPTGASCETVTACGSAKRVCAQRETGQTYDAILAAAPLYGAALCGTRSEEPTCDPIRAASNLSPFVPLTANDSDGDGVADVDDNCPTIFNPKRPLDTMVQADADGDGVGDVCDPCPLTPNATTCSRPDPNDTDGDTIPNATDNCPTVANLDQADADADLHGDACDACPTVPNPGAAACPTTIYTIKQGATGTVAVPDVVVTAVSATGYFCQHAPGLLGYDTTLGNNFAGVFVYAGAAGVKPAVGDVINISSATASDYFGEKQLSAATFTVTSSMHVLPDAEVVADGALIATGGTLAPALEGVRVRLGTVSVTEVEPAPGGGEAAPTYEFVVTGGLRVNDFMYRAAPMPTVGNVLDFVEGILHFDRSNSKVEPRSAADLGTRLQVSTLTPSPAFVDAGGTTTLTLTLNRVPATDTVVDLLSSDAAATVPATVTVLATDPNGSATFTVTGVSQAASVTITATLNGAPVTDTVRVIGAAELPSLVSLTPATANTIPMGTATLTATIDFPARAGGFPVIVSVDAHGALTGTNVVAGVLTIPAGQMSDTFTFTADATTGLATITANAGSMLTATVNVAATSGAGLVINEVDYDMPGAGDSTEFVELVNTTNSPVSLDGLAIVLINGSNNTQYNRTNLTGMLPAGGYLVLADTATVVDPSATVIRFATATDSIQNGAPDGVILFDTVNHNVLDALSYEGGITAATITGETATFSLVEGTVLPTSVSDSGTVAGSLIRNPNGVDTDNASSDWVFSKTSTPGAANTYTP